MLRAGRPAGGHHVLLNLDLSRRLLVEFIGTAALLTVVVGSGIAADRMTDDAALALLVNAAATAAGLTVVITVLAPCSGAHLNPVVSIADWVQARVRGHGVSAAHAGAYSVAQILGAVAGTLLANAMYSVPTQLSDHDRTGGGLLLGEVLATTGLVFAVFALARTGRGHLVPAMVGAYVGAAYWWTSSTSFANPAVTVGRAFTDTYAGISPSSVPPFVAAQLVGLAVALAALRILVPTGTVADESTDDENAAAPTGVR